MQRERDLGADQPAVLIARLVRDADSQSIARRKLIGPQNLDIGAWTIRHDVEAERKTRLFPFVEGVLGDDGIVGLKVGDGDVALDPNAKRLSLPVGPAEKH